MKLFIAFALQLKKEAEYVLFLCILLVLIRQN